MIVVNTNTQSLFAQRALSLNTFNLQKSIEKLSTGYRINRAGDDAAGLSISEGMTSDINGLKMAKQNAGDGISLIQTAEGALSVIQDNLQRIRELKVQASNGTNGNDEKDALQREINERIQTISDITSSTKFNGLSLLTGSTDYSLQTGANNSETTSLDFASGSTADGINSNVNTTGLGSLGEGAIALYTFHVGGSGNVLAKDGSTSSSTGTLADLDTMIDNVSRMRSYLGAKQNSLESKVEYLDVATENASAARSRVKDVDVASESSKMLKNQILQQSAASMLTQANATPQIALSLLPGGR